MYTKIYKYVLSLTLILLLSSLVFIGCGNLISNIDWIDFIKFNDITYLRASQPSSIPAENLSDYETIKFAAYLEIGTPVYSIKAYSPEFRLVALSGEKQIIYEADTNLNAKKGADLLDIGDKVTSISINSHVDGTTELASITNTQQVAELVQMVLDAPVDQKASRYGSEQYLLDFHLSDGTAVKRMYWLDTGKLSRGIFLPEEFGQAIAVKLISIIPSPGAYLTNSENVSSEVLLKEVQVNKGVSDKQYISPWYPAGTVNVGEPILIVSGSIQNKHKGNKEIAMYAEGYDVTGKQVAWTLDAAHIAGQIGLHLENEEIGQFTLHLNSAGNIKSIHIFANNYSVTPP